MVLSYDQRGVIPTKKKGDKMLKVNIKSGDTKPIWQSKTFWANILLAAGVITTGLGETLGTGGVVTVSLVMNLFLRAITKTGVSFN